MMILGNMPLHVSAAFCELGVPQKEARYPFSRLVRNLLVVCPKLFCGEEQIPFSRPLPLSSSTGRRTCLLAQSATQHSRLTDRLPLFNAPAPPSRRNAYKTLCAPRAAFLRLSVRKIVRRNHISSFFFLGRRRGRKARHALVGCSGSSCGVQQSRDCISKMHPRSFGNLSPSLSFRSWHLSDHECHTFNNYNTNSTI